MELEKLQKESFRILEQINKKNNIKHEPDSMFLSLAEEVGEVARELSKKQGNHRGDFDKEKLADELADVITRTLVIADDNNINIDQAVIDNLDNSVTIQSKFSICPIRKLDSPINLIVHNNKLKKIKERFGLKN